LRGDRLLILFAALLAFEMTAGTSAVSSSRGTPSQEGVSILPEDPYQFQGMAGPLSIVTPVEVNGRSFERAYRIRVGTPHLTLGDASLRWITTQTINPFDNLVISFQVRKIDPPDGTGIRAAVSFEGSANPNNRSLDAVIPCNTETWVPYRFKFKARHYHPAGEAAIVIRFGHGPQTFEIGDIQAINLGADPELPIPGIPVIPSDVAKHSGVYFDSRVGGSLSVIEVDDQPFETAFQISTNGISDFIYRSGLTLNTTLPVFKGDLILLSFYARRLEPVDENPIKAQVVFERNGGNYEKSLAINFPNDSDQWRRYQIPFRSRVDYPAGEAHLIFHFGYGPQKFEIADIRLLRYGPDTPVSQLPRSYYYPGRGETDARWRVRAEERIAEHRRGELSIVVRDRNGKPLPGAAVRVSQQSHAFRFGSAVTAQLLAGSAENAEDREIYRSRVNSHFNATVLENDLKWPFWEEWAPWNRQATLDALNRLEAAGLPVRGHNLIWPSYGHMPRDTRSLSPTALRSRIDGHFAAILDPSAAGGRCYQWDVINEPFHNFEVQGRISGIEGIEQSDGLLGNEEMKRWFQRVRSLDPATRLFLNDFDILSGGGFEKTHQDYPFRLLEWLLAGGAPVDGVGFQGHFNRITTPADLEKTIERFAALPLNLAVTEFDVDTLDEDLQADYLKDFLTIIFSHPRFTDFLQWGFWEKAHWIPQAAMYREDWSSKPIALAYTDLVFRKWWTDEEGRTDAEGRLNIRGFRGRYRVAATHLRKSAFATVNLDRRNEIVIVLDADAPRSPIRRER